MAAANGHVKVCILILQSIESKNPQNHIGEKNPSAANGWTPFHYAAESGRFEICELYLKTIKNKHPRSNDGDTPLHMAAANGHLKICILILQSIKSKNPRNHFGQTPLGAAREENQFKVCWLLEKIYNCVI